MAACLGCEKKFKARSAGKKRRKLCEVCHMMASDIDIEGTEKLAADWGFKKDV